MKKRLIILALLLVTINIDAFTCECVHVAASFTKRIKQADLVILGEIMEYTERGHLRVKILKDYSGKSKLDTISIFNGGVIDCLRPFDNDEGSQYVFALDEREDYGDNVLLYEVPFCIESALLVDKETMTVKGNITRLNTFLTRVYFRFGKYDFPNDEMELKKIERKIRRKLN